MYNRSSDITFLFFLQIFAVKRARNGMKGRAPAVAPSTLGNKYVRQVTLSTTLRAAAVYQSPSWQHSAGQGKPEGILDQGG